ncbi:hypothetical protein, partial [uncultured Helicobacter sp.]|uniref:hypothetical protein n=1 Tax=uncultured Helicobacter sp. TaxID=175537 RepID=UPI0025FCBBCE
LCFFLQRFPNRACQSQARHKSLEFFTYLAPLPLLHAQKSIAKTADRTMAKTFLIIPPKM